MGLKSSPKAEGDARHCLAIGDALSATERLREVVGVTRVGMIGELGARGIEISQAARPSGIWSSTYGSGKGETRDAAIVGGVMEEVEKWAQEQFRPAPDELTMASYSALGDRAVDPGLLDLPYDSCYHRELEFAWYPCWNLLSDRQVLVPLTFLAPFRCTNDIYYSPRGCRRLFGTNGLASGFTLEEALVHAMCELVERHASRRHAIATTNPGIDFAPGERQFLDPGAYPAVLARLVRALEDEGTRRVLLEDITGEIGIPVIAATLFVEGVDDWAPCFGWGAHPNPEVAGRMALFEAAQSWICTIAGGREDLTINARSLGRHQRPRPYRFPLHVHCEDPDKRLIDTRQVGGLLSDDAHEEVVWLLDRLRRAGFEHVLAIDLSRPEIAPARVCRVVIPGLDTTNPFYICPRNRMALLGDLLPPRPGRPPA